MVWPQLNTPSLETHSPTRKGILCSQGSSQDQIGDFILIAVQLHSCMLLKIQLAHPNINSEVGILRMRQSNKSQYI